MADPFANFTPRVKEWFANAFPEPTAAQAQAWPAISTGEHTLISAPTGSGKTLAAFLWGLDRLVAEPRAAEPKERSIRLVYVSPLKALAYDVDRNLKAPLRGIGGSDDIDVAIRTGDTPQKERQAMLRSAPDVLITTPESLYLMLTSQARKLFTGVQWVIVDEIHAVAQTKRGAHLALTLERLEVASEHPVQRIGLSATQKPLEEVARFMVGPRRKCTVVDTGVRKPLDLQICVPVESMVNPDDTASAEIDPLEGTASEGTSKSIWPAIYPQLLDLIEEHRSTIVFVNNRRGAERLALRLNELHQRRTQPPPADGAPPPPPTTDIARAHHGSLAREERLVVEELLKSGQLPCLVATSSLELGIDMGAVDLVLQVESPKSVTAGLQRIGRAGHTVGATSKGRIFPKFRADLLECAVVAKRMREGNIETTVVPRNPLDVLAQQIVAIAAATDAEDPPTSVDDLYALVTRTHSYAELSRNQLENVLDMLDGRYPSEAFGDLRARINWDRVAGTIRPRKGARGLAVTNAGTIPDRGMYSVNLPDGRRVGELDEEMVYESRPGNTFLLGASTWRIEEIGRDRVIVTPAPGIPGAVPFWKGDSVGRPRELGQAIGEFARTAVDKQPQELIAEGYDLDERAATNLVEYLREQEAATRVVPSDKAIVIERFRDEIGDWRLCVLTPFGGRVHAAWGLALSRRIREQLDLESDAIWSDDGIIVHLPDADEPPGADLVLLDPDEVEDAVVAELGSSALFGARFRENAARALLIPRAYPGKRTPLWQQRLKSQSLLEVAKQYAQFPIVLETYRECLRDVLDVPGLTELLRALHRREITTVEVETATASPFASSLLFDYVATYMYEGDTPNAERRAAALALDRDLLRELLGQEELRDLIDPGALASVEADLQRTSERARADNPDALHDVLRRVGDLTSDEVRVRVSDGAQADPWLDELERSRRVVVAYIGGEERWIAAEDAGLYRDGLGAVPPSGLPDAFTADVPDAARRLVRRYARSHGPFTTAELRHRYRVDLSAALRELERDGDLIQGELRPGGSEREWCDPDVLRRLRRASLAALRKEIEPAEQRALARFLPSWHGVDRHSPGGAGVDRLREVLVPLQGLALPAETWEADVLPRRTGAYSPTWIDQLCAAGELVWIGAGPLGKRSGKVALYFRDDVALLGAPPLKGVEPPAEPLHELLRERLAQGACFFTDLLTLVPDRAADEIQDALWDLVWAGEATNDAFAPLRQPRLSATAGAQWSQRARADRASARRRFGGARRAGAQPSVQGRWSLVSALLASAAAPDPSSRRRAQAELLLERHGIVTREQVLAEGVPGGFSTLYDQFAALETLGSAQRGYFVEGLGGAQFALSGAAERLRAQRTADEGGPAIVLAATDPAQPYGAALKWPERRVESADAPSRRPARVAGAYVVLVDGDPALYVEKGGKGLHLLLQDRDDPRLGRTVEALAEAVSRRRVPRLAVERIDGEPVVGSPYEGLLVEFGFRSGPRKLTLSA